jgi:PadR family transcriptional regulator, regulatory protein AphA
MSLKHAILGFLNYQPQTGYELKEVFDDSVQHFWPADQSQIYRTLNELMAENYVTMEVVPQDSRPNRKVYTITKAGRDELGRWLQQPPPVQMPRSAALIQVFFSGQLSDNEILQKFEMVAEYCRKALEVYEAISKETIAEYEKQVGPREAFCWNLTVDLGLRSVQAQLEWAENVIKQIKCGKLPAE